MSASEPLAKGLAMHVGIKAVSLGIGFAVATLVFGMAVTSGFILTFIIVAAAVRLALGIAFERPSISTKGVRNG